MHQDPQSEGGRAVPLFWVDAFTDRAFAGNPAGVCLLEGPADEGWMQQLAFELGISETAYTWPIDHGFSLRWFTPTVEVDLCGHATLATAHALRQAGRAANGDQVVFQTRSGRLTARLDGPDIELDLPAARPHPVPVPPTLVDRWPVVGAAAGGDDLVIELESAQAVDRASPDLPAIASLPYRAVVITAAGPPSGRPDSGIDYVLRVFGPAVGIEEDPVTGSAQCLLGPMWAERLGRTVLQVAQLSARSGRLRVTVDGDRVRVAGAAVTVFRGTANLP